MTWLSQQCQQRSPWLAICRAIPCFWHAEGAMHVQNLMIHCSICCQLPVKMRMLTISKMQAMPSELELKRNLSYDSPHVCMLYADMFKSQQYIVLFCLQIFTKMKILTLTVPAMSSSAWAKSSCWSVTTLFSLQFIHKLTIFTPSKAPDTSSSAWAEVRFASGSLALEHWFQTCLVYGSTNFYFAYTPFPKLWLVPLKGTMHALLHSGWSVIRITIHSMFAFWSCQTCSTNVNTTYASFCCL